MKRVAAEVSTLCAESSLARKLTLGERVKGLEARVASMLRAKHAVFLTNATAGFEIAFKFAGLKPGDEVIAPAITFIATIAYPLSIGAKVVLADVDPVTINMDPRDVARKITPRTKAIIPVHLGGYPVDMDPIMKLARRHGITVIEDAAHAFGGSYKGRMLGTVGDFGAFSFHEVKNVTAMGEGGILVTDTPHGRDFAKARFLGLDLSIQIQNWLYDVIALDARDGVAVAGNHSATEIQAVGLAMQLKRLKGIIAKRRQAANYLTRRLAKVPGLRTPPGDTADIKSTHHLYLLQVDPDTAGGDVQVLKQKLSERGIVNIPHFGPLYKFSIMRQLGYDRDAMQASCPVAEDAFNRRFTHLPLYEFERADLDYMADAVIASMAEMRQGR
jgi:dTDP-4-amino-4,6-dideoxygalactose transaminase